MSAKYAIVPPYFTASQVDSPSFRKKDHYHVEKEKIDLLRKAGVVEPLNEMRRIFRYIGHAFTSDSRPTGDGRLSRQIPWNLQAVMKSAMTQRPMDEPMEIHATA